MAWFPGAGLTAGALEDSYLQLFKARDPRVVRLLLYAEVLVAAGRLSVDDVAAFLEANASPSLLALLARYWSVGFTASVLNSASLSVAKAAALLEDASITAARAHDILADRNIEADRVQAILYQMISDGAWDRLLDIITETASDATVSAATTVTGAVRYRNLTVDSGVTLTVDGQPGVIIARTITNNGSIVKTPTGGQGGAPGAGVGRGGNGGGGLIIVAKSVAGGEYHADGEDGESGTTTDARALPRSGEGGFMVVVGTDTPGTGGKGAAAGGGAGKHGGGGGSSDARFPGGNGGAVTTTTYDTYADLASDILKAAVDYYIVKVLGKTPTTTVSFPDIRGAGGGGGLDYDGTQDNGGGGGGGGQIIVVAYEINDGIYTARGGSGGNGGNEGLYDCGGGGGGGGIVYVIAKNVVTAPLLDTSGGAGGTGNYAGAAGTAGTAKYVTV